MVNTADIDKSANANWGIRQVSCFFPVYFFLYEENQKGRSSDLPLLGPQGGPKMQIQAKWSIQIVNKAWKFGCKSYLTCQRQLDGVHVEKRSAAYYSIYINFIKNVFTNLRDKKETKRSKEIEKERKQKEKASLVSMKIY